MNCFSAWLHYRYLALFVAVFSEQIGIPVPSLAFLVGAGAMVASHEMALPGAMAGSAAACILADCLWFSLGRKRGYKGLTFACKLAVDPEACAAKALRTASRCGARVLVASKFVPGLSVIMPAVAGLLNVNLRRFLLFDCISASIWAGTYLGIGIVFHCEVKAIISVLVHSSSVMIGACAMLIAAAILWRIRYAKRQRSGKSRLVRFDHLLH